MHTERAGQTHPGEPRLPAAVAVIAAIVLYAALPNQLLIGPRYVVPGLELILFVPWGWCRGPSALTEARRPAIIRPGRTP
jgi:hypothetical protein